MDDDSQDELINRNAARGKKANLASLAGVDDSSEGPSGGSGEDTGSEDGDGEDVEEEEEEEGSDSDTSDDDDDDSMEGDEMELSLEVNAEPSRGQPALPAGGSISSDEDTESCPICLNALRDQAVGTPENCAHYFCLDCIVEWSKNANSCPVDRILFQWICIRARFGGKVLKKIPVESKKAPPTEEEDPTFCEVCGRSDREDRLLLCDGCDAGYHMECLNPSLSEVPVDEWFCPECVATAAPAAPRAAAADTDTVSEEEVALLLVDVVPTASRLRPSTGRTRAIARTRQSERVRATVNRNRITTAQRIQRVPRYLMSSLLDETIDAVASGLSTAVYQRPVTPRTPVRRKRKTGRRKKASGRKKASSKSSVRSKTSGTRPKRRRYRTKKRKGQKSRDKTKITARSRIARTLGLGKPLRGASIPSVYRPGEPSLGFMRADIGAASLSLFGDPYELDPYDSGEELPANQASPLSTKRRVLSQSALRSHQPVARPVSVGLPRRSVHASVPEQDVEVAPVPDLLGSILSGQNLLMMSGSDIVINRDGSLTARKAAPISLQRSSVAKSRDDREARTRGTIQPRTLQSETLATPPNAGISEQLGLNLHGGPATSMFSASSSCLRGLEKTVSPSPSVSKRAAVRVEYSMTPRSVQTQSLANRNKLGLKPNETPLFNGDKQHPVSGSSASAKVLNGHSPPKKTAIGQPLPPAPRKIDISELPRIPKMKREGSSDGHVDSKPAGSRDADIPSSCINRLTGREGGGQPSRGGRGDSKPSGRDSQEPKTHSSGSSYASAGGPGSHSTLTPFGPSRGKGLGSSFESFRINIPGNTAHSSRLPNPGFCNTFRPVDNKVQRKENPSPLFSIKKTKQIKSEIYDPFDPTGSDSSSPSSSPERLGAGLLPSEITRTISVDSPKVPTFQTVRCVTSYTVENVFGSSSDPCGEPSSSHPERISAGVSDLEKMEEEEEEEPGSSPCASTALRRRLSEHEPLEADGRERRSTFFDTEERTVTCVTIEPTSPGEEEEEEEDQPSITTHRIVEIHSPSRSRSNSSSRSRKKAKRKKASAKEHKKARSHSRSRSASRERSSRSTSWSVEEDYTKKHRFKAKPRRSSSDRSSSHDRAKKKRAKDKGKEKRKGPWSRERRKSRSRSGSPGSSSYEVCESRKKRRRRSGSRGRGREGSHSSSTERGRRHKRRRQKSFERYEKKERGSRPRDRRSSRSRSRDRRKWRSRSPSASRSREHKRARSREKRPRSRSRSRDRKQPGKDASPPPLQEKEPKAAEEITPPKQPASDQVTPSQVDGPPAPLAGEIAEKPPEAPAPAPAPAQAPDEVAADDLDYGETVGVEHPFEDFSSDAVFIQLDDMSSPPSPESTDSSPERGLLLPPLPVGIVPVTAAKCETTPEPLAPTEPLPVEAIPCQGTLEDQVREMVTVEEEGPLVSEEVSETMESEVDVISQLPLLKSKALVKRVTWNLQEEEASMAGPEPEPRAPFYKLPRSLEGAWKAEDSDPTLNQVQSREPPPTNYMVAEPMFPDLDCSQVYSPNMPLTPTLPASVPPYAPVSQPTVQFIMQGSLPLLGCGPGQSLTPEPATLAAAPEPSGQSLATGDTDEKVAVPKPAAEKTKNEEYMKKLHVQERAVEEVKLAIKPFYQKREITKDEYKDILRKAVQKICHSKSGEINPMKVANLVKAYVEKYKHMRKHKKTEPEEEPHEGGES